MADVESYGGNSDSGVLANSELGKALQNGTLRIPEDDPLSGTNHLGTACDCREWKLWFKNKFDETLSWFSGWK
jgi:hypothetical protein